MKQNICNVISGQSLESGNKTVMISFATAFYRTLIWHNLMRDVQIKCEIQCLQTKDKYGEF